MPHRPRRAYDQFCAIARALDAVGDRWALLIARELLAGPRRYTDLHADLPGVSTDVLATRLRDLERDGVLGRRKLPPPGGAVVYELTPHGRELLPVLAALATWGAAGLAERRPTDAVRAHWFAVPLLDRLQRLAAGHEGVVEVELDEGAFHLRLGAGPGYGEGRAERADARLSLDTETCVALARDDLTVEKAIAGGRARLAGASPLAARLRGDA
ncbi:winged helix-turn-helix transcriptional regulator [Streptomyces hoynatensis]|uniref:Transcriptional regulator n=1 Tax=Streptomyces hoynatensis TaxID=1141874 RepID=A0A3A9ZGC9_9ACTN|nr:helix-turn-helix domain-containing protein [Streptomyces hoynatensis]RKN47189.1 transcriptional regulator [Streptomyces hoynatensis]